MNKIIELLMEINQKVGNIEKKLGIIEESRKTGDEDDYLIHLMKKDSKYYLIAVAEKQEEYSVKKIINEQKLIPDTFEILMYGKIDSYDLKVILSCNDIVVEDHCDTEEYCFREISFKKSCDEIINYIEEKCAFIRNPHASYFK